LQHLNCLIVHTITVCYDKPLCLAEYSLDLCRHYRNRDEIESQLTEYFISRSHPRGNQILIAFISEVCWGCINKGGELVVRGCKPWLLKITIKEIGFVILLLKLDRDMTSILLFPSLLNSGYYLNLPSNSIFASSLFIEVGFAASRIKKGCGCVDIMTTIGLVIRAREEVNRRAPECELPPLGTTARELISWQFHSCSIKRL
jgi:hypothetical protein